MGRSSRFTFPVPGRKQKAVPSQPDPSAPLTKAQKILGTGQLNLDSSTLSTDSSGPWETRSNSGISISVSESTTSFTNDTGLGRLDEDEVVNGVSGRRTRWEEESAVLPWERPRTGSRGNVALGGGTVNDTMTDASSLRRRQSSSTINTYYDKSKVPLSISQQTASSAMAKGLPTKASALLDMDGSLAPSLKPKKKKPSRLDLSYLIPKSISNRHLSPPEATQKGLVLGTDMMTRSPSIMSDSPDIAPPPIQQRTDRKPRKKLTLESLLEKRLESVTRPGTADHARRRMRTTASANELHNLYEHYEQRSFQEMMGEPVTATADGGSPTYVSSPQIAMSREFLSPYSGSTSRVPLSGRDRSNSQQSGAETPTTSLMTSSSLKSPAADCAASVSSRHTRTSKASKRTDRSMPDLDLLQNSMLSLSSDSEDDYGDRPDTSLSAPRRPSDSRSSPSSPNLNNFPQPPSPQTADSNLNNLPRRVVGPMSPTSYGHAGALHSPSGDVKMSPPKIAARTSSLSLSSGGTMKPGSVHSVSRFSLASSATGTSATPGPTLGRSDGGAAHGARAIALIPAHGFRHAAGSHGTSPRLPATRLSNTSDLGEPPLSPTSIDFYLQSQHNSMAFDRSSIRSGKSIGTLGGGGSIRSPTPSSLGENDGNSRLISVTRQEEMLLAALRIKRARMLGQTTSELDDEQDAVFEGTPLHHPQPQHHYDQRTLQQLQSAPSQPLPDPFAKQRSSNESKRSSSRQMSRQSSLTTVRLAPLPEQPQSEQQQQTHPSLSVQSAPTPRIIGNRASDGSTHGEGQIHVYIDRRGTQANTIDLSEPSPDLSGIMDFDQESGYLTSQRTSSDAGSGTGSGSGSGKSRTSSSRSVSMAEGRNRTNGLSSSDLGAAGSSKSAVRRNRHPDYEDVHVRIAQDSPDVRSTIPEEDDTPRPDSPLSPGPELPLPTSQLPKKKQVRLSAVGYRPMEAGWWADDG